MNSSIVKTLTYYNNASVSANVHIRPLRPKHCELTFVLDGQLIYYVEQKKYVLKKNDAVLIKSGMHLYRPAGDIPVSYVSFNFTVFEDAQLPDEVYFNNVISPFVRNMISSFPHNNITPLFYSREKLTNILNVILFEIIDRASTQNYNHYVREIIDYINQNITIPLTLKNISKHVHLSNVYTSQLFKAEVGTTITDFINECKMKVAKDMLWSVDTDLKTLAESIGYQDYGYFSRVFKKQFGYSPNEYRKKIRTLNK